MENAFPEFLISIQHDNSKLTKVVLQLIERHHNGDVIDQIIVKKAIESFVSLGIDSDSDNLRNFK